MKFSLLAIAALAPSTMAEFNLRSTFNQMFSTAKDETYDARIVVGGLTSSISKDEVKYVSKQAVAAFNEAFGYDKTGKKIGDIEPRGSSNIRSDSFWWAADKNSEEEAAIINAAVQLWSNKGEPSADVDGSMMASFEHDLCSRLRTSGFRNFVQAKDCSFSFIGKPGMASQLPVDAAYPSDNKQAAEAQLALVGLKKQMTKADGEILNKAIVDAHKEVFGKSDLSLVSFQIVVGIPVEGHHSEWLHQCPWCCYTEDDDRNCASTYDAVTLVMATVVPLRSSASSSSSSSTAMDAQLSHEAFETFVCTKLRNSGSSNFENVHDCNFSFVYGI